MFGLLRKPLFSLLSGLILISIFNVPVFSQELPKQEPGKTTKAKQHSETYNRGTKDLPVIIEIVPSAPLKIETDHDKEAENKKAENEWRVAGGTIAIAVFTLVLAIATIALAVFTFNLWGETGKLVIGADGTARRQLRAYVFMDVDSISIGNQETANVTAVIRNYGKTPAYGLECRALIVYEARVGHFIRPPHERLEQIIPARVDIPPTGPYRLFFRNDFNPQHRADMLSGKAAFYIFGRIDYRDAFEGRRWTTFCYVYRSERRVEEWQWEAFREGNEST